MSSLIDWLNANAIVVLVAVQIATLAIGLIRFIVELKNEKHECRNGNTDCRNYQRNNGVSVSERDSD